VCVSLFYVIDTGSIGSRARHHVMGWGLPIVWTVERIIEETFESGEGGGPMRRSRSPSRGGEVGNLSKMGSIREHQATPKIPTFRKFHEIHLYQRSKNLLSPLCSLS